jgi:hypothetical protein
MALKAATVTLNFAIRYLLMVFVAFVKSAESIAASARCGNRLMGVMGLMGVGLMGIV